MGITLLSDVDGTRWRMLWWNCSISWDWQMALMRKFLWKSLRCLRRTVRWSVWNWKIMILSWVLRRTLMGLRPLERLMILLRCAVRCIHIENQYIETCTKQMRDSSIWHMFWNFYAFSQRDIIATYLLLTYVFIIHKLIEWYIIHCTGEYVFLTRQVWDSHRGCPFLC